jgi:hypothetical protein
MQAPRWVLIWHSQGKKKVGCRCRPTRGLSFHLAYDRMGFNGLLSVVYGARKKKKKLPLLLHTAHAYSACAPPCSLQTSRLFDLDQQEALRSGILFLCVARSRLKTNVQVYGPWARTQLLAPRASKAAENATPGAPVGAAIGFVVITRCALGYTALSLLLLRWQTRISRSSSTVFQLGTSGAASPPA